MKGGTLFSGIGAPELAAPDIDWRWCAETEPFAAAVLEHHFGTLNLGDVTKVDWDAVEPVDLIVFGSPCQSFSVAGKRLGLDDPRGNLALVGLHAVSRARPRWLVFENVPGLLSSDEGRDFGAFLGLLAECGYGFAYRVLDAQHFGVPQRRRRLFVVGHLADWRPAAAVLFEPQSLRGDPPPRREPRQGVARPIASSSPRGSGYRNDADTADNLVTHSLRAEGFDASEDGTGRGTPLVTAFDTTQLTAKANYSNPQPGNPCHPLASTAHPPAITSSGMHVRRLTPTECERLQGFPDNFSAIIFRNKPAPDGPRYRTLGNAIPVPVIRWMLARITSLVPPDPP